MDADTLRLIEKILMQNQDVLDMNRILVESLFPPVDFALVEIDGGPQTMQ